MVAQSNVINEGLKKAILAKPPFYDWGAKKLARSIKLNADDVKVIELVHCGSCEKMITPNLIASFGADHHDPDQTMCESCFAGAIDTAEARAETL